MRLRIPPERLVVLAGVAAAMHVAKLSTALPVLRDALGVSLVQAGFLLSLVQLAGMLLGALVGLAADGLGLRRTLVAGLLLLSLASIAGGFATSAPALMGLRALEGLGFLLASMPAPSLIRRLVPAARVSAALGWWGAYMPLGTAGALLLGPAVIAASGWQGWWWALGASTAAMAAVVVRAVPADTAPPAQGAAAPQGPAPWAARLRRTLRASGPWLVAALFAAYSSQWLALVGFLPTVYQQAGLAAGLAGAATALVALVNMAGNIAAGRLLQRGVPAAVLLRIGFGVMALGGFIAFAPLPLQGPAAAGLRYAAALAFSMVGGLVPGTLFSLAVRLAPGEDTVSSTVGWMQQGSCVGQFAGPPLVAALASAVGGWQWSGGVTAACAGAGLMLTLPLAQRLARAAA